MYVITGIHKKYYIILHVKSIEIKQRLILLKIQNL